MTGNVDDNQKHTLEEALEQFVDSQLWDKEPDIDEFVKRYPEYEHQIRKRIQKIQRIHALFDSLVQADESDFEDASTGHDLVGKTIGSFEIVEMIGRGGMGIVYLARDTKLKRSVAIKSIPAELAGDLTARMRFRREAELLASLNHPNIGVIYEIIEEEKSGYLVLEYVPGETLTGRIASEPLELEKTLSISRQIAEAVSAAHEKGVIHRDLKPGNIKITPDGRVKVLDFGLAIATSSEGRSGETTDTQPGHIIGTPAYMSPEQARGKKTDHRTDIWSFGCIMFQMLTGQFPFEGETATDTLARIIEREPDWGLLPETTPTNIRDLLHRCLEKDPDRRLGDIADVVIEISETLSRPVTMRAKSRRTAMIIGAVIIIVLCAIAVRLIPERQAQPSPKQIRLAVLPTENMEAYKYYLRGNQYLDLNYDHLGVPMYEKAVELDPNFALAYAQLCGVHLHMYVSRYDRSEERLAKAKDAVEKALELNPDLPEVRLALGKYYYQAELDYDRALEEFEVALKSQPNNSEVLAFIGYVHKRQGKFEQAVANLKKACEFDPRSHLPANLAVVFIHLRRFAEAERALDRTISLTPEAPGPYRSKAMLYLCWQGDTEKARAVLEEALEKVRSTKDDLSLSRTRIVIDIFDRDYQKALDRQLSSKDEGTDDPVNFSKALQCAQICMYMEKEGLATEYFEEALSLLRNRPKEDQNDPWFHSALGIACAGLGRKEDAIREGKLAVELLPVSRDAMNGPDRVEDLAQIYVMVGENDLAIKQLEYLLSVPSGLSKPLLRLDPLWDSLRDNPRFKKLIELKR